MRKIFLFISFLVSLVASSQTIPFQAVGNSGNEYRMTGIGSANKGFVLRNSYTDTTEMNTDQWLKYQRGIQARSGDTIWQRSNDLTRWFKTGSGSIILDSSSSFIPYGDGSLGNPLGGTVNISTAQGNAIQSTGEGLFVNNFIQDGIKQPGAITWIQNYDYDVSPAIGVIGGVEYTSVWTPITLANSDPTNDRIDLVVFNAGVGSSVGTITVITGTPAADPQQPTVADPSTQLAMAFILVTANTTAPPTPPTQDWIYINNAEWTTLSSTPRIDAASIFAPYSVPLDIRGLAAQNGDNIRFTSVTPPTISNFNVLTLKIRSQSIWVSDSRIGLRWYSGGTPIGNTVYIANGAFGYTSTNLSSYQIITISLSNFGALVNVTNLLMTVSTTGGRTISFLIDDIQLQNAVVPSISYTASNGLTLVGNDFRLGQNVGESGNPAALFSAREIPLNGFRLNMTSTVGGDLAVLKTRTLTGAVQADRGLVIQSANQVVDGATVTGSQAGFMHTSHNLQGTANFGVSSQESASVYLSRLFERSTSATAASVANSGSTPLNSTPTLYIKNGVSGSGGTVTMNGWYSNINSEFQLNPTNGVSVIANFIDINIGLSVASAFATVGTRYGLYINPIKQSFVTGIGYSIFQEGATDRNYLAGETLIGSNVDNGDYKLQVTGGVRIDATGKEITLVGLDTDNTATQIAAKDASGNTVWRDASSISGAITANEGLIASSSTNVQLGSTSPTAAALTASRYVYSSTFTLNFLGVGTVSTVAVANQNGTGGTGLDVTSDFGIGATIGTSNGTYAASLSATPTSTNTVQPTLKLLRHVAGGTAADGIGTSLDMFVQHSNGQADVANQLISKWSTANSATRVSQFIITGVNSAVTADLLTLNGNGSIKFNDYGTGTNTGTATYLIATDADGDLIEVAVGGGLGDVTKVGTPVNDQLGVWTGNGTIEGDVALTYTGGALTVGLAGTTLGQLILGGNTAQTVTIRTLATAGNYTLTLPSTDGNAGEVLSTDGAGNLSFIAAGSVGTVTSVSFTGGLISVATPTTTPAFTVAGTSGGIPYFSSASTWASSAALAANAIVIGGGAGVAPATTTTGTGVLTALGLNVGSAGAFVTFDGALGTPSSGVATNLTGLPLTTGVTGTLDETNGGTGLTSYATGDVIYATGVNTLGKLTATTNGFVLTLSGGVPVWATAAVATITAVNGTTNQVIANTVGTVVTLSTPQDIHTSAGPQFNNINLGGTSSANTIGLFVGTTTLTNSGIYNSPIITPAAGASAQIYYSDGDIVEAASGTHGSLMGANFVPPTITPGAAAVTNTATVYISGAMSATVTGANYSLWVGSGDTRLGSLTGSGNRYVQSDANGVVSATYTVFNPTVQTLTDGATITWNVTNGGNAVVTLAGTGRTLSITNPVAGYTYTIEITQGSGGSKTITTWPTGTTWSGGVAPTLSTTAGDVDVVVLYYNGTNYRGNFNDDFN